MDKLMIKGAGPLHGEVAVSGAKNAALPELCASLLSKETIELDNLPGVADVLHMCRLLTSLGVRVTRKPGRVLLKAGTLNGGTVPETLSRSMRASILCLGPLVARLGFVRLSLPGGCAIGARPVDFHLKALEKMGAEVVVADGFIEARAKRLKGAEIHFPVVTVTGTENIMMAATLANGTTTLHGAAREPEIVDLGKMLIAMGAEIEGLGGSTIVIRGKKSLNGASHTIIPDRIEAGTWICAAAVTAGHITVKNMCSDHLVTFLRVMEEAGLPFKACADAVEVFPHRGLRAVNLSTHPHPGFPTDLQAQVMTVLTQAGGSSLITENIFENRFKHALELQRMGADLDFRGNNVLVHGPRKLTGTTVKATDLRASAALVLAGLAAGDITIIEEIYHLDRGYDRLEQKLSQLGGYVRRMTQCMAKTVPVIAPIKRPFSPSKVALAG